MSLFRFLSLAVLAILMPTPAFSTAICGRCVDALGGVLHGGGAFHGVIAKILLKAPAEVAPQDPEVKQDGWPQPAPGGGTRRG